MPETCPKHARNMSRNMSWNMSRNMFRNMSWNMFRNMGTCSGTCPGTCPCFSSHVPCFVFLFFIFVPWFSFFMFPVFPYFSLLFPTFPYFSSPYFSLLFPTFPYFSLPVCKKWLHFGSVICNLSKLSPEPMKRPQKVGMCHLKIIPIHFLEPEIGPKKLKNWQNRQNLVTHSENP